MSPTVLISLLIGGCVLLVAYIVKQLKMQPHAGVAPKIEHHEKRRERESAPKGKKKQRTRADKQVHPWLLTTLKGHTGAVLHCDYSSNGKYLATCGEDRAVLLWDVKDLSLKEHKSLRVNIEFDNPTFVKWSPDSKAFIIHKHNENALEVYKIEKKKDGWFGQATKALTFPKSHDSDVIGMGIASSGKYLMTCSNKTDLVVWDLKGQKLAQIDTYLMNTICAKLSPCGKFIAASGFAPDAKVWEVIFSKTGEFQEVKRVFELSGHTSGIYDVAFDADSSHMATVSKDGTWKLFDTNVEYKKGEDPRLRITGKYQRSSQHTLIALSPNSEVVVIATGNSLSFFSTLSGLLDCTIDDVFTGNITDLLFDSLGKYLLAAGDKHVRVYQNVTGYKCNIETAKEKLKLNQTSATKERLEKLIQDCEAFLGQIEVKK